MTPEEGDIAYPMPVPMPDGVRMTGNAPGLREQMTEAEFEEFVGRQPGRKSMYRTIEEIDRMATAAAWMAEVYDDKWMLVADALNWAIGADTAPLSDDELAEIEDRGDGPIYGK